ncbi:hypothetical protein E4T38_08043 [Aureobasidium subglaciale]|nr:hypothetical protein E4T38_08043 [Aureobasidium subglaciale]KAI5216211.1 hypothetical protein E4T40_08053 [Aureobasidium subglaciale]KAI5219432.1 hypothetical protein E4T41_07968 [Aureobasidium subglaciale]KAI5256916.1 hypothetical protein E4T46_07944 [Aureobasidium subglaciale]
MADEPSQQPADPASVLPNYKEPPDIPKPDLDLDLSVYTSDGTGTFPQNLFPTIIEHALHTFSEVFNHHGHGIRLFSQNVNFVGDLPHGYAAFSRVGRSGHTMVEVWGHPCGRPFDSFRDFSVHVVSLIYGTVWICECGLCTFARGGQGVASLTLPPLLPRDSVVDASAPDIQGTTTSSEAQDTKMSIAE